LQDALKKMRILDDSIIYALNVELPTDSFKGDNNNCSNSCRKLYTQMETNFKNRDEALHTCITFSRNRINELKKKRITDENNISLQRDLRREQQKVSTLQ